jgi:hypothetical protein
MADVPPKKCPVLLLAEARRIANASFTDWPNEFSPKQIAALMAGGWKGEHKTLYQDWCRVVESAIKAGTLFARSETQAPITITRDADALSDRQRFVMNLFPVHDGIHTRLVYTETKTLPPKRYVDREACANWLAAIDAQPSEYIAEWLRVDNRNRLERRIEKILEVLKKAGYDVMAIPVGGKKAAEVECLKFTPLFTKDTFLKAWTLASTTNRLAIVGKEVFSEGR